MSMKAILGTMAFGTLLAGCATTVEMGPGYYHYDTGLARPSAPAVVYQQPAVVYQQPAVVYREPTVVYRGVYREPAYRFSNDASFYNDHGQ
jgi:hypothetical protein